MTRPARTSGRRKLLIQAVLAVVFVISPGCQQYYSVPGDYPPDQRATVSGKVVTIDARGCRLVAAGVNQWTLPPTPVTSGDHWFTAMTELGTVNIQVRLAAGHEYHFSSESDPTPRLVITDVTRARKVALHPITLDYYNNDGMKVPRPAGPIVP